MGRCCAFNRHVEQQIRAALQLYPVEDQPLAKHKGLVLLEVCALTLASCAIAGCIAERAAGAGCCQPTMLCMSRYTAARRLAEPLTQFPALIDLFNLQLLPYNRQDHNILCSIYDHYRRVHHA